MNDDLRRLQIELHRLEWAQGLDDAVVAEIAAVGLVTSFAAGRVVIESDTVVERVYFILSGQVEAVLFDRIGKELRRELCRRGSVVGLFSLLLEERSYLRVEATEDSRVVSLRLDELLQLTASHRDFQLAMFRLAAGVVKRLTMVDRDLPKPSVVAVAHQSDAGRFLTPALVRQLSQLGELIGVAGDDERSRPDVDVPFRSLYENGVPIDPSRAEEILREWRSRGRLFIDFGAQHAADDMRRIVSYADVVLWCLRPHDAPAALTSLAELERIAPGLCKKVALVWILDEREPTAPYSAELSRSAARDFKVHQGELLPNRGELVRRGLERVVRYLRGVQIGLALGGGAARGMAHLGVLKALERHGICVDMLAGTSAGAMVGGIYASGFDPAYSTLCFKNDLLPNWFFRQVPGGGYWYLIYKYRRRLFGPMLRKYVSDLRMEQLVIPTMMVSVDLCDGEVLLRDTGDVADNILESINLSPLSLPIVQGERAIVDGGLLNNVPADALLAKGCNFVIASTVTAKLEKDFMGVRGKQGRGVRGFTASLQVLMRQNLIQSRSMNAVGVKPADFVIAPDVTAFDISEFTRADEMAVIGDSAVEASVSELKGMLSKLDPKLFPR